MNDFSARIFIETPRLYVRTWSQDDIEDLYNVMSNPAVHQYTAEKPWNIERCFEQIDYCIKNKFGQSPGLFNCPLICRKNGHLIGLVGLNPYLKDKNIPEIEFFINQSFWSKGYATEIGAAILEYGFKKCGFASITGLTSQENIASKKVLHKIGMRFVGNEPKNKKIYSFYQAKNC
ncbi:GNAT family N-acetyltransferase [Lentisphaerota bacterium ZTH]|nr:GNAT family N-acetyltransferase [Lentisphaerota bacterium]WET06552.1 GNAT family N-acetyltransferase [Lentisphaerota bacterium ZTH]